LNLESSLLERNFSSFDLDWTFSFYCLSFLLLGSKLFPFTGSRPHVLLGFKLNFFQSQMPFVSSIRTLVFVFNLFPVSQHLWKS
jgi:hypothetical protein